MIGKRNIIAVCGLIAVNAISYFIVLPIAQKLEDQHYGDGPIVILYVSLAIALPFIVSKYYVEENEKTFRKFIRVIMLVLFSWAGYYWFLECSFCSTGG